MNEIILSIHAKQSNDTAHHALLTNQISELAAVILF